jgi:hypothetical protein
MPAGDACGKKARTRQKDLGKSPSGEQGGFHG